MFLGASNYRILTSIVCVCVCVCVCAQSLPTLEPQGQKSIMFLYPWKFPDKNTAVDCLFLLQGIILTQGLNLCLLYRQAGSLLLHHLGSLLQQYYRIMLIKLTSQYLSQAPHSHFGITNGHYINGLPQWLSR